MPEGDTVHRVAGMLDHALSGHVLVLSDFRVPGLATLDLAGATVERTFARGKHLLTRVEHAEPLTLHTHLGMDGSWRILERTTPPHDTKGVVRVLLGTADRIAVGSSLKLVQVVPRREEAALTAHLGPDLLGSDWDETEAVRRLMLDPVRPIAEALLDQRNLAGIGNVYAAELCFTSGVHPASAVSSVVDLPRLVRRARLMLEANKDRAARTTTGNTRRGERTWVYGRAGSACRRCGTTILSTQQGPSGRERVAYWCPSCQPQA